nr:MAG TPA: hypothetical protein [Caudoviricetes sp.]
MGAWGHTLCSLSLSPSSCLLLPGIYAARVNQPKNWGRRIAPSMRRNIVLYGH